MGNGRPQGWYESWNRTMEILWSIGIDTPTRTMNGWTKGRSRTTNGWKRTILLLHLLPPPRVPYMSNQAGWPIVINSILGWIPKTTSARLISSLVWKDVWTKQGGCHQTLAKTVTTMIQTAPAPLNDFEVTTTRTARRRRVLEIYKNKLDGTYQHNNLKSSFPLMQLGLNSIRSTRQNDWPSQSSLTVSTKQNHLLLIWTLGTLW